MMDAWLIHTCTVERDQGAAVDDYNAGVVAFGPNQRGVPCRMVVKMVREPFGLGENPVIPSYRLFLPGDVAIQEGDRIVQVLDEVGEPIGQAWSVSQVLVRRSTSVLFQTVHVEKAV
jgi:hypothetical protein